MRFIFTRALFYVSLAVEWALYVARYWILRALGNGKDIAGVRVLLLREGSVVLVRHWLTPGVWTLPGGGVKKGETPEQAAVREIREELGYTIKSFGGEVGTYRGRMGRLDSATVLFTEDFEGSMQFLPNIEIMERSLFELDHLPHTLSPANRRRIESYAQGVRDERGFW